MIVKIKIYKEIIKMATSSFTTELKFDTEEKISSFLEAVENAKNNKHYIYICRI